MKNKDQAQRRDHSLQGSPKEGNKGSKKRATQGGPGPTSKAGSATPARQAACEILYQVLEEKRYSNHSLDEALSKAELDLQDRRFASAMVYGTLHFLPAVDYFITPWSKKPLAKLDPWLRTILRLSVWQIHYGQVPDRAAVNEGVNLAKQYLPPYLVGYCNGVLRNVCRHPREIPSEQEYLSYGIPAELHELLTTWYSKEKVEAIYAANAAFAGNVTLRLNPLRTQAAALTKALEEGDGQVRPGKYFPHALHIDRLATPIAQTAAYAHGDFSIQDEAGLFVSQLALSALATNTPLSILDACAAPGSKTFDLIARLLQGGQSFHLWANDKSRTRLSALARQLTKLLVPPFVKEGEGRGESNAGGKKTAEKTADDSKSLLSNGKNNKDGVIQVFSQDETKIYVVQGDWTQKPSWLSLSPDPFDLVLADVPCSSLGTMDAHPELRQRITKAYLAEFPPLQLEILEHLGGLVRPGGLLIYSTCTINPQENQDVIAAFLKTELGSSFERVPILRQDLAFGLDEGRGALEGGTNHTLAPLEDGTSQALASSKGEIGQALDALADRHAVEMALGELRLRRDLDETSGFFICRLRKKSAPLSAPDHEGADAKLSGPDDPDAIV